ncbi:MAG: hypothetical protein QOH59_1064 [Gemmatimonadales bacterium]|nr:hypothetical protein [Gemmatimonadales bacterium]
MRSYWMRIALGAAAIFIVGMVGLSLVRRGLGTVHGVVHGSGPISIPLAFIPFQLNGDKLGTLQRLTLQREAPNRVTSVELEVKLSDSLLARGLEGCRLAANLESDTTRGPGLNVHGGPFKDGSFWCAKDDSTSEGLVEYGHAIFHPGNVKVPLLLSEGLVDELQDLDFDNDSTPTVDEVPVDSIVAAAERTADSVTKAGHVRMGDSLRAEGRRRGDSARSVVGRMADSARGR